MDFNEAVKKRREVQSFSHLEELDHVRKAKYLLTTTHKCSIPINGKLRVQIT